MALSPTKWLGELCESKPGVGSRPGETSVRCRDLPVHMLNISTRTSSPTPSGSRPFAYLLVQSPQREQKSRQHNDTRDNDGSRTNKSSSENSRQQDY